MSDTQTPSIANDAAGAHSLHRLDMRQVILDYEIRSSWWAAWIGNERLQNLTAKYFAWKVWRKFGRWEQSRRDAERLNTQDQRRLRRPLHPLVRWRIFSRSQVSDGRETGVFLGKNAFLDFFWIGACLPSDVRYT